jgi:hypothetical protein
MNAWSEEVIDAEDLHRRCAAHHEFLANSSDAVAFAENWADRTLTSWPKDDSCQSRTGSPSPRVSNAAVL